ncbi:dihydropteroate synthase [Gloeobacter kilaueensis JS1]|uniref:Dihydropteroate synthase n=2 Tax=Gloeobacter TaxID=33071 RepID=U5QKN7_GLOK1|nr:dihydropteroate synthase [Gloeobacter kilaueensis JS1]
MAQTQIVGIVNITSDSFSDGGQFLEAERAIAHGHQLLAQGAHWLDLGAESSNPEGEAVCAATEMARLEPVIADLRRSGARISVDTHKSAVIARALELGAGMVNDITALKDPASVEIVKSYPEVPVVLMFSQDQGQRAKKQISDPETILDRIERFFAERIERLLQAGLNEEQLIIDPGMGYFLGSNPEASLRVLAGWQRLRQLGRPLYLCASRKSFIGNVLGGRPVEGRAAGTLACEIWAYLGGIDYLRTHAVAPLSDAIRVLNAIRE